MDLFKLGLRNVVGITLPGALVVLAFLYCLFGFALALPSTITPSQVLEGHWTIILIALFLLSYVVGSLFRLNSAAKLDDLSAKACASENPECRGPFPTLGPEEQLRKIWGLILSGGEFPQDRKAIAWIWQHDVFPYPVWEFMKFKLLGKEFFNYCKMAIYHASRETGGLLAEEVSAAEAVARFYAGTYYSFVVSALLLAGSLAIQVAAWALAWRLHAPTPHPGMALYLYWFLSFFFAGLLATFARNSIMWRFRTLRLKEVDTVFDAFYLVHRHARTCPTCSSVSLDGLPDYKAREALLRMAFARSQTSSGIASPLDYNCLIDAMREQGSLIPELAHLYFAGAEGDHPYFLKNDRIALGLSVQPEDADKAGAFKRHPHQTEVLFVLEGELSLEIRETGQPLAQPLKKGGVFVIKPDLCHRIQTIDGKPAVYLFVKTNPDQEPREEPCPPMPS